MGLITGRPGYPSLGFDCLWGEENALRLAVVLKGDELEVLRPPRSAIVESGAKKAPSSQGPSFSSLKDLLLSALDFQCIIDTGCEDR